MTTTPKVLPVTSDVPAPKKNSARITYDFAVLKKNGDSFGVIGRTKRQIRQTISNANAKAEHGEFYYAEDVNPETDPDKATVRVWRDDTRRPT